MSAAESPEPTDVEAAPPRVAWRTMAVLGVGYMAIYLCRKNLAVAIPLLQEDFDVNKETVGWISSAGTFAYAIGKLINGPLVDRIGGRAGFLMSMAGVMFFGAASAFAPGLAVLGAFYAANRFAGAAGWGALIKLVPTWFRPERAAGVLAVMSISYVAGGVAATMLARSIAEAGGGWRAVMGGPAIVVAVVAAVAFVVVRPGPRQDADARARPDDTGHGFSWAAFAQLVRRRSFVIACTLSFTVTLLREAFNTWSVDYLTSIQGGTKSLGLASVQSIGFDVMGIVGILVMGVAYGRLPPRRRGWLIAGALVLLAVTLAALPYLGASDPLYAALAIALIGFLVYGPFSLLSGVMALEAGGHRLVATAAGLIDGVGYIAGALSGASLGHVVDLGGYRLGFHVLALTALVSAAVALLFRPSGEAPTSTAKHS